MKRPAFFLFVFISVTALAQALQNETWIISHNSKQKLKTATENEQKNLVRIPGADLKRPGQLFVNYTGRHQKDWKRIIALYDTRDNELLKHNGNLLKVGNSKLNSLANSADTIKIYTMALPSDPAVAATVRVRRIHLATLVIQK